MREFGLPPTRRAILQGSAALAGAGLVADVARSQARAAQPVAPALSPLVSDIDDYVAEVMKGRRTPGVSLAVTDRSGLLFARQYGHANLDADLPVLPETRFAFGSVGKTFTAVLIMQLVEEGKVDLHVPVTRYLPWFRVQSDHAPITIHHLLSHTSGLIYGSEFSPGAAAEVWALRDLGVSGPPGGPFHYSNVGYKTLGLIIEAVTAMPYRQAVQERIFDPLGMERAANAISNEIRDDIATGYIPLFDDRPPLPEADLVVAPWIESSTADGSLAASATELAAFLRALLDEGRGPRRRLLDARSVALMAEPVADMGNGTHYGYALFNGELYGRRRIGHTGGVVGYAAVMFGLPESGIGAVVLSNGPGDPVAIARHVLAATAAFAEGRPPPDPPRIPDPTRVENAADYAGTYSGAMRSLTVDADGNGLFLRHDGGRWRLLQRGPDAFSADHTDFALYFVRFGRDEDGKAVEMTYGPEWLAGAAHAGPRDFDVPEAWKAYPGHYRSHNPWHPSFRIGLRQGGLWLFSPDGGEERLEPTATGFRPPAGPNSPLRLSFDQVVDGKAQRARWNGGDDTYYRFFTD